MKSFKVLSLMTVFLLLFGGVALAQNAASVFVEVGYPCPDGQDECDTDAAVSREAGGDIVNILITLLDADGNPATAGPNGELLSALTATVSTTLGDNIEAGAFAADAAGVAFGQDATARSNIDYTGATPGVDLVVVTIPSEPDALVGQASVNVVAPPATGLVVRTLRNSTPPQTLYQPIPDQAGNLGGWELAGNEVQVTVLAQVGGLFTPDPSLEGKTVIVQAYADYNEDGVAGSGADAEGYEDNPLGEPVELTISGGQVTGTVQIDNAGPVAPEGLNVVFTAEIDEQGGISTTLMNGAGLDLVPGNDFTLDTVEMRPGSPAGLLVGMDSYGNGNLVMEQGCLSVFDDAAFGAGTTVNLDVILVDALGNAVLASGAGIDIALALGGGELEAQLSADCVDDLIDAGDYQQTCSLQDTDPTAAGQVIRQNITLSSPQVSQDQIPTNLLPASATGTLDLTVTLDAESAGQDINAGDEVVLTLTNDGGYFPFAAGETLAISATGPGGAQLISESDFASAATTLEIPASDADGETEGLQLPPIAIFGPCTTLGAENVTFTATISDRCDESADSDAINDIDPGDPANLAVVGLADGLETESDLDDGGYVGTDPVVVDTPLVVGDGDVDTLVLDCGDLEVRDEYDNVLNDAPVLQCAVGLGFTTIANDCDVTVSPVVEAIDTTQTLTCQATDPDYAGVAGRNFSLSMIEAEEEGPSDDATALVARQEAPQDQDGTQILPCGEAIVQIFANGTLDPSPLAIQISLGEGSVEGAEIRGLASDQALEQPLGVNLGDEEVLRYVIYSPDSGPVNLVVTDASTNDPPLADGTLALSFCVPTQECTPIVTVTCGETELCDPEEICTTCTAETTCDDEVLEGTYTWEINGEVTTANTVEVCGADLTPNEENILTATDTTNENAQGTAT